MIPSGLSGLQFSAAPGTGLQSISLSEIVKHPDLALPTVTSNFRQNWQEMALAGFATGLTFKFAKRILRKQISNINRQAKAFGIADVVRL